MTRFTAAALLVGALSCKATPPSRIEQIVASNVKRHLTVSGRADRNPVPATPLAIREGETAYFTNCAICHGVDGPGTSAPFARTMSPPVPDLSSREVQGYTDGQLHSIIENGLSPSGMPAGRGILSDGEMWRIVLYIRQLAEGGARAPSAEQARASQPLN